MEIKENQRWVHDLRKWVVAAMYIILISTYTKLSQFINGKYNYLSNVKNAFAVDVCVCSFMVDKNNQ